MKQFTKQTRRIASFLLLLLFFCSRAHSQSETEPNNDFASANDLPANTEITGSVCPDGDLDYFKLTLPSNGIVRVYAEVTNKGTSNGYFYVNGYDQRQANGSLFTKNVGGYLGSGATAIDSVDLYCQAAGQALYLRVSQQYQCFDYKLHYVMLNGSGDLDAEPNNDFSHAVTLPFEQWAGGHLGYLANGTVTDPEDNYKFTVPSNGIVRIYMEATNTGNGNGYFYVNGYDQRQANGSLFTKNVGGYLGSGATAIDSVDLYCRAAGDTIYLKVTQQYQCFNYRLRYTVLNASDDVDAEPNNTFADAKSFAMADSITGHLGYVAGGSVTDNYDYFKTVLPASGVVRVYAEATNTGNGNGYFYVNGYDQRQANGSLFTKNVGGYLGSGATAIDSVDLYCRAAGDTFYFQLSQQYQCFNYKLRYAVLNPSNDVDQEPNNDFAHAVNLNEGDSAKGHIGYILAGTTADAYDYYKTVLPSDGAVRVYVEAINTGNGNGYFYVNGYDQRQANGSLFTKNVGGYLGSGATAIDSVDVYCRSANDTFYFQLSQQYQCFGYKISYKVIHVANTPALVDVEPNNSTGTAVYLANKDSVKANIGYSLGGNTDNYDYYKTMVPYRGTMRVYIKATNTSGLGYGYFYLAAFDKNGTQVFSKNIGGYAAPNTTSYDTLNLFCRPADSLWFQVSSTYACFNYQLGYELTLGADTTVYVCPGYTTGIDKLYNVKPFSSVQYENMASPGTAISPLNLGAGTYRLTVYNGADECSRDTAIITVANHPQPQPGYTVNSANQCQSGNNFVFTNTSTIASGTMTYQWTFGDGSAAETAVSPAHTYTSPGIYTVRLIATSNNGCVDSLKTIVTVYPQPSAGYTLDNSAQCQGRSFSFTNTAAISSGTLSYQWSFGDGDLSTSTNASHSYSTAGIFAVKLIATSEHGCKDSAVQSVSVYSKPVAAFTINSSAQCAKGNSFVFTNTSTGASSYAWNFGDGATSATVNPTHRYTAAGNYTVILVVSTANGCADTVQQNLTVNASPALGADKTITLSCEAGTADITGLYNTSSYATVAYSASDPQHAPAGVYTLVVSYATGCSDTAQITVAEAPVTTVSTSANLTKTANRECTDAQGWTHYYDDNGTPADPSDDIRLLSIMKNGNNIGALGDGTFRVEVKSTAGAGSGHAVNVNSPFVPQGSSYYSMNRYWKVTPTVQPLTPLNVRFYYNDQDLADVKGDYPGTLSHTQLKPYKVDTGDPNPTTNWSGATAVHYYQNSNVASQTTWVYTALANGVHQAEFQVSSFSGGGAGALSGTPLPLTFTRFDVVNENGNVSVQWTTASESNTKQFSVLRSPDGRSFETIGTVAAAGNSTGLRNYAYKDEKTAGFEGQTLYYKLAETDLDGRTVYTDIRKVKLPANGNSLSLYFNPVRNEALLKYQSAAKEKIQVQVIDQSGKVVVLKEVTVTKGTNQIHVNTAGLAQGVYHVVVSSTTGRQQVKMLKG